MFFHPFDIQTARVVRMVVLDLRNILAALGEEFVVVQVPRIARNTVIVPHVDRLGHLLACNERFVELFAVPRADHLHLRLAVFRINLRIGLLQGFGKGR